MRSRQGGVPSYALLNRLAQLRLDPTLAKALLPMKGLWLETNYKWDQVIQFWDIPEASLPLRARLQRQTCTQVGRDVVLATLEEADEDEENIVNLEEEILEVFKVSSREFVHESIMEQKVELAGSSGEARSSGPGADDATSASVTAVGNSVGEDRPRGVKKYKAMTESELAESSGEFPVEFGEARPPGVAKYSAATAATAVAPTVAKSVGDGEARPPELIM